MNSDCLQPFVTHVCKKPIRSLVTRRRDREIGVLQEKSTLGNQLSLIPYPNYSANPIVIRFRKYM